MSSAQQATQPAVKSSAASASDTDEAAKKAELLSSQRWRKIQFGINEWLSVQPFYDEKQVAKIKADMNARIAKMSLTDVEFMLDDYEAKFQIMATTEAQAAQTWFGQYISFLNDQKRAEALKDAPNLVTMTAAQLRQSILKLQQKRASLNRQQKQFDQARQAQVDAAQRNDQSQRASPGRPQQRRPTSRRIAIRRRRKLRTRRRAARTWAIT